MVKSERPPAAFSMTNISATNSLTSSLFSPLDTSVAVLKVLYKTFSSIMTTAVDN